MLGNAPQYEDFPPDDGDFDPNDFDYHGFGQPRNDPPPPLAPAEPFEPNMEHLQAMGSAVWPQQDVQAQNDL